MAKNIPSKRFTEDQLLRRAELLRRKQEQKRAHIERQMRRATKHSFDFTAKL